MLTLQVEKRIPGGMTALRAGGRVPGVVYGPHHEATSVAFEGLAFEKIFRQAGESSVIVLAGLGAEVPVLVHEVDLDPITSKPHHVDFYAVTKGEKVEVMIPIEFVGESPAVKAGANLVKVLHEIEVKADPMKLPQHLAVDISVLATVNDQIHVRDIKLPTEVELVTPEEDVVVLAQEVVTEEEAPAAVDISSIEIEKKGKEEAGEEATEA